MPEILTACPCCDNTVTVISGADDFKSTTITLSACKFADKTAVSVVWKKSAVLAAEAAYQNSLESFSE